MPKKRYFSRFPLTAGRFGDSNSAYAYNGADNNISGSFNLPDHGGPDLYFVDGKIAWNTWDYNANSFADIPATASDGKFHNYIVVADSATSTTKLYYDGSLLGTAGYRSPGNQLTLGGAGGSPEYHYYGWHGVIDDVAIYDTAFSAQQADELYKSTSTQNTPVPEPATMLLMGTGLAGLVGSRRKRK